VKGFWDLPEPFPGARPGEILTTFTHTITHRHYTFTVREATGKAPPGCRWFEERALGEIPLATITKKALDKKAWAKNALRKNRRK
jgi:adenine-specific DNA glycosylase